MQENSYEEYIRSVLGYPANSVDNYYQTYEASNNYMGYGLAENYTDTRSMELEECYPEIYRIVYPMVKKACQNVTGPVTKDEIDRMVDELYLNIEGNNEITINSTIENINNVQTENRSSETKNIRPKTNQEIRTFNGKRVVAEPIREPKKEVSKITEERETRHYRPKNCAVCDLIKILLLRELIGEPGRPPFRPGGPGRPPFPPPGRPPYRPF